MIWVLVVLIILLLGGVAVVAVGYGASMQPAESDRRSPALPAGRITATDLREVRFNAAVRGYRMDEVDELISRLVNQMSDSPAPPPSNQGSAE
ncbi:MAG TPA: DivIVA domain-containing protein [Marmoricola sp.]|nr:DivIVA domain-containing protein [Marmoricola sp.]HNI69883.1 DivIVA domain-containing protein [Marmoricola sp.]HNO40367.1 DivIVA domain-containing protein [Marmoricola sp.]